jgi:N-dimethylarginine dimethylaminohydrolase
MRYLVSRTRCETSCSEGSDSCAYRVAWAINPHMRVGAACPDRASLQHANLVATLRGLGAHVDEVPFVHGAFDSVFAKDSAVVVEREGGGVDALVARPRFAQRRAEQEARATALLARGIRVLGASRAALEGGDVVMLPGARAAFLGHGFRSEPAAAQDLADLLDADVTCIALRDARLYHLDMALAVLDDGTALVCADAMTPESVAAIEAHPLVSDIVLVPLAEALCFGTNVVQVGAAIVTAADAPATRRALAKRGYRVRRVVLDDFHLAGGSAACLTARVHRQFEAVGEELAPESRAA